LFDIADHGGSVQAGLARVVVEHAKVIGVTSDMLFPVEQQRELAEGLKQNVGRVEYVELGSIQGHDSFLVDMDGFRPAIREFFRP
jgi:homoserine O-acetyltransferase